MISVMNRKITLDVLAVMIQEGFLDVARRTQSIEERLQALELRVERLEKRVDSIEERMENGFYNITQELQKIKKSIKQADDYERVAALEIRVDVLEKKIG
jgi:archaellum component FlaC